MGGLKKIKLNWIKIIIQNNLILKKFVEINFNFVFYIVFFSIINNTYACHRPWMLQYSIALMSSISALMSNTALGSSPGFKLARKT